MLEAIYVVIGLFFGGIGVWITTVNGLKNSLNKEKENSTNLLSQNAVLKERISGINEKNQEKIELLEKNKEQMKLEFKELADKILESNSQKFSTQNQENLSKMITPIKEQFSEFKKQIDDVYVKEAKDRSMLQAEIKSIKEINHQMSLDAKNLTSALKGESKKQGVWGEMILESVLENSGLREGHEYEREVSMEHESDGSRYRPDVVVHLPDTRDIIIDAKTSLTAYEQYVSCDDEKKKEAFASGHVASMKKHIKELSEKDYTNLKGVETLDFIFMFVPIESALLMAMEYDSTLFDHAFKKSVILVGPTTLMVSLRAVENTWKYEHQQRNAKEIAQRAGLLFDKFVGFIDSVEKLGKQITTVQNTYDDAFGKMHSGAGSITSQFKKLEKLGAAASKGLPEHINRQIEE
jgi:DNA recombination protein RmuC